MQFQSIEINSRSRSGLDADNRRGMSHSDLLVFLAQTTQALHNLGIGPNDRSSPLPCQCRPVLRPDMKSVLGRCAVAVPNGPELATCLLACLATCTCAPINPDQPPAEVPLPRPHLQRLGVSAPDQADASCPLRVARRPLSHPTLPQARRDLVRTAAVALIVQVRAPRAELVPAAGFASWKFRAIPWPYPCASASGTHPGGPYPGRIGPRPGRSLHPQKRRPCAGPRPRPAGVGAPRPPALPGVYGPCRVRCFRGLCRGVCVLLLFVVWS